jgi:hypothetical protein
MKTIERTNGTVLPHDSSGEGIIPMPEEFAGLYQAGYEAGFASGHEAGYRQGFEAGFGNGRRQRNDVATPAAVENAPENAAAVKSRLFGLPCTKCRRLMYSDESRCPYCKTPRPKLVEPPSATCCDPEEVRKREPDGGLEAAANFSAGVKKIAESELRGVIRSGLTGVTAGPMATEVPVPQWRFEPRKVAAQR